VNKKYAIAAWISETNWAFPWGKWSIKKICI